MRNPVPSITLNGAALKKVVLDRLLDLRVDRTTSSAGVAELRFKEANELDGLFTVGTTIGIGIKEGRIESSPIFEGIVVSLGVDLVSAGAELTVGAFDESFPLGLGSENTSHNDVSAADLFKKIAQSAGLQPKIDSSLASPVFEFVQQTGTPHQFLSDLAAAAGCEWFVKGKVLHVRPRQSSAPIRIVDAFRFRARLSMADQASSVVVRGWDPTNKEAILGTATANGTSMKSKVPVLQKNRNGLDTGEAVSFRQPAASIDDARVTAEAAMRRMESAMLTGRGEVLASPDIVPGCTLDMNNVATAWDGEYYVTGVEHVFGRDKVFMTRFSLGALEPRTLVDLLGGHTPTSATNLASALTIGVVDNIKDDEQKGRVRVTLPYIDDEATNTWARVVQQGAGPDRGWVVMPEVGDEVVVAFENGDLRRPLVLGGLWNGRDKSPDADIGTSDQVQTRSFTSRMGHKMIFSDGDDPADLFVSITLSDDKAKFVMSHEKIELHSADKPIEIKTTNAQINLTEQGKLTLKANEIVLDAKKSIEIKGPKVSVTGQQSVALDGAQIDVKASGKASLSSGGITEVKGSMVKVN